jgi:putative transcriptional regulator
MLFPRTKIIKQPEIPDIIHNIRLVIGLAQDEFMKIVDVTFAKVNGWKNRRTKLSNIAVARVVRSWAERAKAQLHAL